jgi:hypothetical protein
MGCNDHRKEKFSLELPANWSLGSNNIRLLFDRTNHEFQLIFSIVFRLLKEKTQICLLVIVLSYSANRLS